MNKKVSKRGKEFGTGIPDGIAASEAANNAAAAGAFAPLLALGIPGSGTAAVLLILFIWDNIHTFHAILRENSDYRMVEDSLKELAVQFKGFQLYSLDEPLSARIQAILDQTDADERLQEALSRMQQNWHQRISAFRHSRRFP